MFTSALSAQFVPLTDYEIPACNPEDVYATADRFGLDELKDVAFNFLVDTRDESNILARVFGTQGLEYEELGDQYTMKFYELWNDWIRGSSELAKSFDELEKETNDVHRTVLSRKCWELMRDLEHRG